MYTGGKRIDLGATFSFSHNIHFFINQKSHHLGHQTSLTVGEIIIYFFCILVRKRPARQVIKFDNRNVFQLKSRFRPQPIPPIYPRIGIMLPGQISHRFLNTNGQWSLTLYYTELCFTLHCSSLYCSAPYCSALPCTAQ